MIEHSVLSVDPQAGRGAAKRHSLQGLGIGRLAGIVGGLFCVASAGGATVVTKIGD